MEANKDYISAVLELVQLQTRFILWKRLRPSLKTNKMRKKRRKFKVNLWLYQVDYQSNGSEWKVWTSEEMTLDWKKWNSRFISVFSSDRNLTKEGFFFFFPNWKEAKNFSQNFCVRCQLLLHNANKLPAVVIQNWCKIRIYCPPSLEFKNWLWMWGKCSLESSIFLWKPRWNPILQKL